MWLIRYLGHQGLYPNLNLDITVLSLKIPYNIMYMIDSVPYNLGHHRYNYIIKKINVTNSTII